MEVIHCGNWYCRLLLRPYQGRERLLQGPNLVVRRLVNCRSTLDRNEAMQIMEYAREAFSKETRKSYRSDADINLLKACMLIALEEEAAVHVYHASSYPLWEQTLLRIARAVCTPNVAMEWARDSGASEAPILVDLGSPSSWNLSRLDSLAKEATAEFRRSLGAEDAASTPSAVDRGGEPGPDDSAVKASFKDEERRTSGSGASMSADGTSPNPADFPMMAITAVNEVLFGRHGYKRMASHENPRDMCLPYVLETGRGSAAALSIIYIEICSRMGLPISAAVLEEGRHCVVWPTHKPLQLASGEDVVVDVYSGGAFYRLKEVQQHFGLPEEPVRTLWKKELLLALLERLRDVHWCKSLGCRPEPGLMVPISVASALKGDVPLQQGYQISRATAAAERCVSLVPLKRELRMKLAVLSYFIGNWEGAMDTIKNWILPMEDPETKLFVGKLLAKQGELQEWMEMTNEEDQVLINEMMEDEQG